MNPIRQGLKLLKAQRPRGRTVPVMVVMLLPVGNVLAVTPFHVQDSSSPAMTNLSATSVTAFANEQIPKAMRADRIPGAVFAVVSGNRVVFQKGYGLANAQTREPVSTSNTLFRVASLSKIFTAASVLQMVHAHYLNLNRNVNRYLTGFQITPAFGKPITLFDLLTHSSGFDVDWLDYAAQTAAQKLSLRNYLIQFQPLRLRPPGLFSAYDNYGYTLAGYLVQKVSGIPFPQYVEERLLDPLDMQDSSFSPDTALRRHLATGYWLDDGTLRPYRQSHVNITPAAGLCSTAADMSRFLVALLTNRRPDSSRAFSGSVRKGLLTQQFAFSPEVPGRCFGFDVVTLAGHRVLRQTGQWPGFNSLLLVFPGRHCGLFVAYNLCDQMRMGWKIARLFAEHFVPPQPATIDTRTPADPIHTALARFCGSYLSVRYPQDSPDLGEPREIRVTQTPTGQLKVGERLYQEIGPLTFAQIGKADSASDATRKHVAFRKGRDGNIVDLITDSDTFRRAIWGETRQGRLWLLGVAVFTFLLAVVLWPMIFLIRFISALTVRKPLPLTTTERRNKFSRLALATALAACILALWFEVALTWTELQLDPFADIYGIPHSVQRLFWLIPVLMFLSVALSGFAVVAWRKRLWDFAHRLHYTMIPVALILLFYVYYCQHLLFVA